jgi:NAD(P)-dependent dehydrogenase (short-subunit alcohol dehydrogenase family)
MKLENKIAVVTGAGQGLGRGIALCLAEEKADVAVIDLNMETAAKVAKEIEGMGCRGLPIGADATDKKTVEEAIRKTLGVFGRIDILVTNVGGHGKTSWNRTSGAFLDQRIEEWDEDYELVFRSHVLACQAVAPHFTEQRSGKIVTISSLAARLPNPTNMTYGVNKNGIVFFTKALSKDLAKFNINVNCVCPGVIYTPNWERLAAQHIHFAAEARRKAGLTQPSEVEQMTPREFFEKRVISNVPLGREQTEEDIGRAVVFLVSEDAKNITGQALNVCGGQGAV